MYRDGLSLCQVWRLYFQPFWFYRADRQTEFGLHTDAGDCHAHATTVGVSDKVSNNISYRAFVDNAVTTDTRLTVVISYVKSI